LDPTGFITRIFAATANIDAGRKGYATKGEERDGRVYYERGIAQALSAFAEVSASDDPKTIVLAEYTFVLQELHFCDKGDRDTFGSLTLAAQGFDDAFLCLEAVENAAGYGEIAEKVFPHTFKFRVRGFPKDAFHIACRAHKTRIRNVLRSPGIDTIEKNLLKQRRANLSVAEKSYMKKQGKALTV